jgi:2-polyprenyl-3-methyl-5-hydroxy-6-metoxy-1,4-benzoquinol methylase
MRRIIFHVPVYFPEPIYRFLRTMKKSLFNEGKQNSNKSSKLNLIGDRDIEWSWIAAQMPEGPGAALDFGPGGSSLALLAARRGFRVTAVDLMVTDYPYTHPNLSFVFGDLLELDLKENSFDLVINCSTVEHVGLAGRYGVTQLQEDGDLHAMAMLHRLLNPQGKMLLTIPVGLDAVFSPLCRVYGSKRLPLLLQNYEIEKEAYWIKQGENRWKETTREIALSFKASAGSWDAMENIYALGCFVLTATKE